MNKMTEIMRSLGKFDALTLRAAAPKMSGTEIITSEYCVPAWDSTKDYSVWTAGAPVSYDGQVWTLIQPHNAANYDGTPATLRALWGLCHTKDPARAKAWVAPYGTSGMYMTDECYKADDGTVYRCKQDNTIYDAAALPTAWKVVNA